jgi:hypothetical protein
LASAAASPTGTGSPTVPATSEVTTPLAPSLTPVPAAGNAVADRILATVRATSGGSLIDLPASVEPWGTQVDGTVDDGDGPGRLFVAVSPPGQTGDNLCQDRDFTQGGRCRRVPLATGDVRFERDLVAASGTQTIVVAIRRVDGSSVLLEAGNFRVEAPPVLVGGQPRPTPEITRAHPVFTLDELAALADAISEATRDCSATTCP